ncbi:hypothetical protein [Streptomyces sp. NRRL F-525]|uniref:hypothetical protein n=1 Tax=Streptomyces sp. NRRL F-525 TaxID=1463861 RepID=UPI0005272B1B|nr:hypothetical protein [Streptomyces sp. NRRL F-525]
MNRRIIYTSAALAVACLIPTATPAAASTSACTHHWSGPQVCIRITGRNEMNSVTAIWVNPPKTTKTRIVQLYSNGKPLFGPERARRVGTTISYTWNTFDTGAHTRLCVKFASITRTACDSTTYSGVPGPL